MSNIHTDLRGTLISNSIKEVIGIELEKATLTYFSEETGKELINPTKRIQLESPLTVQAEFVDGVLISIKLPPSISISRGDIEVLDRVMTRELCRAYCEKADEMLHLDNDPTNY